MDLYNLAKKRRSVRSFEDKIIEPGKIGQLINVLQFLPSSRSIFPLEFIVVVEKELLKQLAESKDHGASFLKDAPAAVVIIADEEKSDAWVEDASIAATFLMFQAVDLDLGTCWIQIRERQRATKSSEEIVKEILNIPEKYRVEAIIALGYPNYKNLSPKPKSFNLNKIFHNQFKKTDD
ncbi:MAG: nitroreductase family protein [Bacteroidota bacterium]